MFTRKDAGKGTGDGLVTGFKLATDDDFYRLVAAHPDGAFEERDIIFIAEQYPGETMPEGMRWSLKQLGNLHALDLIKRADLTRVLEIGPGFNLYFPNHLPERCEYFCLDDPGYYDATLLARANAARTRGQFVHGLLGDHTSKLPDGTFDACISVSVLEHLPEDRVQVACTDMIRLLRPGGWTVHSIDLPLSKLDEVGRLWLKSLRSAGFEIDKSGVDLDVHRKRGGAAQVFAEPLAILTRFYGGFVKDVFASGPRRRERHHTILVAARKPER